MPVSTLDGTPNIHFRNRHTKKAHSLSVTCEEKKKSLLSLGFAKYPIYHFNPTHWSRVYTNFSLLGVEGRGI